MKGRPAIIEKAEMDKRLRELDAKGLITEELLREERLISPVRRYYGTMTGMRQVLGIRGPLYGPRLHKKPPELPKLESKLKKAASSLDKREPYIIIDQQDTRGIRRLAAAVLQRAATDMGDEKRRGAALYWIEGVRKRNEIKENAFTFENCCGLLDISPSRMREKLLAIRPGESVEGC